MAFTGEQKQTWQREYQRHYHAANPERIREYHRRAVINRAMAKGRLPAPRSMEKYSIKASELEHLLNAIRRARESTQVAG